MKRVLESSVASAVVERKVIPNGINLELFKPGDRPEARRRIGVPEDALVLLFAANRVRVSPFKDRSEEHTSELQSLMLLSYAVVVLKKKSTDSHTRLYDVLHIDIVRS